MQGGEEASQAQVSCLPAAAESLPGHWPGRNEALGDHTSLRLETVLWGQAGHLVHVEGLTVECPRDFSMHRGSWPSRELGPADAWACFSKRVREQWGLEPACLWRVSMVSLFYLLLAEWYGA